MDQYNLEIEIHVSHTVAIKSLGPSRGGHLDAKPSDNPCNKPCCGAAARSAHFP